MSLLNLLHEMLLSISTHMSNESFAIFLSTSESLQGVARAWYRSVRLREWPIRAWSFLEVNSGLIFKLDLSGFGNSVDEVINYNVLENNIVLRCQHLTELNLGTIFISNTTLLRILEELRVLRVLICSLYRIPETPPKEFGPFSSLRELYVEAGSTLLLMKVILDVLNQCDGIEILHVHLKGECLDPVTANGFVDIPLLAARWNTLHTVVCSLYSAQPGDVHVYLLKNIFADNPHILNRDILNWIANNKECYIYESGKMNRYAPINNAVNNSVQLLRRLRCVDLSDRDLVRQIEHWGPPSSLRITDFNQLSTLPDIIPIIRDSSRDLVELDLTECHGYHPECARVGMLTSSPRLQVLAATLCFFLVGRNTTPAKNCQVSQSLQKLILRKLFVRGKCFARCDDRAYPYPYGTCACRQCKRCATRLTSENLVQLTHLKHLEEYNFDEVELDDTAYGHMVNSSVHTVRLNLSAGSSWVGLHDLIKSCKNLRNFKLGAFKVAEIRLDEESIWEALEQGKKLKKLCLTTNMLGGGSARLFCRYAPRLSNRIEFIHFHAFQGLENFDQEVRDNLQGITRNWTNARVIVSSSARLGLDNLDKFDCGVLLLPEHSLCRSDSYIGLVKPRGGLADPADT